MSPKPAIPPLKGPNTGAVGGAVPNYADLLGVDVDGVFMAVTGTVIDDHVCLDVNDLSGGGGGGLTPDASAYPISTYASNPYGPIFPLTTPPILSSWTQLNFNGLNNATAVQDSTTGAIFLNNFQSNSQAANAAELMQPYPTAPFTLTIGVLPNITYWQDNAFAAMYFWGNLGLFISDGTSSRGVAYGLYPQGQGLNNGGYYMMVLAYATLTPAGRPGWSFVNGGGGNMLVVNPFSPVWFQYEDDGTTRHYRWGQDGVNFFEFYSEGNNPTDGGVITPTLIGLHTDANNNVGGGSLTTWASMTLLSWKLES